MPRPRKVVDCTLRQLENRFRGWQPDQHRVSLWQLGQRRSTHLLYRHADIVDRVESARAVRHADSDLHFDGGHVRACRITTGRIATCRIILVRRLQCCARARFSNAIPPQPHGAGGRTGASNSCSRLQALHSHAVLVIPRPGGSTASGSPSRSITSCLFICAPVWPSPRTVAKFAVDQFRRVG